MVTQSRHFEQVLLRELSIFCVFWLLSMMPLVEQKMTFSFKYIVSLESTVLWEVCSWGLPIKLISIVTELHSSIWCVRTTAATHPTTSIDYTNCPQSRIEVRPTALLRYHAHTGWTSLTFDLDRWPQLSIPGKLWTWPTYRQKREFKGQLVQNKDLKQTDRQTDQRG